MAAHCILLCFGPSLLNLAAFLHLLDPSNPATWVRQSPDPGWYIAVPLLLLMYYLILFLLVHRPGKPGPLVAQYAPPQNLSPAALRYLFIGDSDGRSVAAALLQLASRGLISVKGHKNWFIIHKLADRIPSDLSPEELKVFSVMFLQPEPVNTQRIPDELLAPDLPADAYPMLPFAGSNFNSLSIHVHRALRRAHESVYFTRHLEFTVPAAFLSIGAVIYNTFLPVPAFWISCILIGAILVAHFTSLFQDFIFRRFRDPGNWTGIVALLLSGSVVMAGLAHNLKHFEYGYLFSLLATLVLNLMAPGYLRVPKLAALALAPAINGYREFLSRVEVDPLHRLDHPEWPSGSETQHMAYAVALDLPGAWEAYVASSHPRTPMPLSSPAAGMRANSADSSPPASLSLEGASAHARSSVVAATMNPMAKARPLREIPLVGAHYRFVPAGQAEESESPLRRNWWRYGMVTLAIAYVCSPLFDTDPIAAYGTLFAVLLVLGVLGWLFRRRD
jgi:hypothetical protein